MSTIRMMILLWPLLTQCIVSATDCDWVRFIYEKMGGDALLIPPDCCEMEGVICEGDRVTELGWTHFDLKGFIPPEIGNLVNLERLNLEGNELSGPLPREIWNLVNLEELDLSTTKLSGSIPQEIGNLRQLQYLFLQDNQLSGSIPKEIWNLENLVILNLSENKLSGSIPKEIGNLVLLWELYLENNQLSGSIPQEIGNLQELEYLKLSGNHLNGEIPEEIGNLRNLLKLGNSLSGTLPSSMTNLGQLEILDFSDNELEGSFPEWVHGLADLNVLNLGQNRFTGDVPHVIGDRLNSLRDHFRLRTIDTEREDIQEEYTSLRRKLINFFRTHYRYLRDSNDYLWLSNPQSTEDYKDYVNAYIEAEEERLLPSRLFHQIRMNSHDAVKAVGKYIQRLPPIHDGNPATKRQRLSQS